MTARRRAVVAAMLVAVATASCAASEPDGTEGRRSHPSPAAPNESTRASWSVTLPNSASAIAADDDGAVVIAGDGDVLALDTAQGRERWRTVAVRAFLYAPAVDRDTVIVSARDRFVAFERATGAQRWEAPVAEEAGAATLATEGESALALLTTEPGSVTAVDALAGATEWSVRHPGRVLAAPAVDRDSGSAAVTWNDTDNPTLRVLDLGTGDVRWEATIGVSSSAPIIGRGVVLTGEGDAQYGSRVVARDVATGAERWSVAVPASFEPSLTPGVDGGEIAIADHFGTVTMLDVEDGSVRWQRALEEPVLQSRMLVTETAVVLTTHHGNLVALDRDTGRVLERRYPGGYPAGTAVAGGKLLVALRLTDPGRVVARPAP